jgi:hypothetical protein
MEGRAAVLATAAAAKNTPGGLLVQAAGHLLCFPPAAFVWHELVSQDPCLAPECFALSVLTCVLSVQGVTYIGFPRIT